MRSPPLVAVLSLLALAACASETIESPPGGSAGKAGAGAGGQPPSGSSGAAGAKLQGGAAGASNVAGSDAGGSAGASGGGGPAGASGSGNPAGAAGATSGAGGSAGANGGAAGANACSDGFAPGQDGKTPIFVAADGKDTNVGTEDAPLATLEAALALAAKLVGKRSHLYVAEGTYDGAVVLPDVEGLVIEGGYKHNGQIWTRTCDGTARELAVITAASAGDNQAVVTANDLVKGVSLVRLTVKTKDQGKKGDVGKTGETLIGIHVKGNGSKLALDDVAIVVGKGGDGGEGTPGGAPPGAACNGLTECEDGTKGEDGKDGAPAPDGTFGENGYTAGVGATGTAGAKGKNGTAGAAALGSSCALSCPAVDQASCPAASPTTGSKAADAGSCGCGESSRAPGKGAASGGASVGVLVGAGASLSTSSGRVATAGGGAAPEGGAFGPSIAATEGGKGADSSCISSAGRSCAWEIDKCVVAGTTITLAGGAPGGKGGEAGKSGKGGPGAGGQSFAIVKIGNAVVELKSEPTYQVGPGGKSGPSGPSAKSGNIGPLVQLLDLPFFLVTPMRTASRSVPRRLLACLAVSAVMALSVAACSGDEFVAPASGGGSAGGSGSAGAAAAGRAGGAGVSGVAGGAGASGAAAGTAGQGGGGAGGSAGAGAASGTGGAAAGTAGSAGSGGSPPPGACSESSPKFRCIGTQLLQQCNPSTKLYETLKTCGTTEQCNAATQTCDACKAGAPDPANKCATPSAQLVCAADGSGYTESKSCPPGASFCKNNVCEGCKAASDCPPPANACQLSACSDAKCGTTNVPKGPPPGSEPSAACVVKVCDGNGSLADEIKPRGQTCGVDKQCDGLGGCLLCLPAPGPALDSSATACADGLLCVTDDVSSEPDALFVGLEPNASATNSGTASSPLTLTAALDKLAADPSRKRVYVLAGLYAGAFGAIGIAQDVTIEGGFVRGADGSWRRDCGPGGFQATRIKRTGTAGAALYWKGSGAVELRSMRITSEVEWTPLPGEAGRSSTALEVRQAKKVSLVAVALDAGKAVDGASGRNGFTPTDPFASTCPAETGENGENGAPVGAQADGDAFGPDGFVPGMGLAGKVGSRGRNGVGPGQRLRIDWTTTCPGSVPAGGSCASNKDKISTVTLAVGNIGCGGDGGAAAEPGAQGGGSFGLYLGDVSQVDIVASRISARIAGRGGRGGLGADGAQGSTPSEAPAPIVEYQPAEGTCAPNGANGNGGTFCKAVPAGPKTQGKPVQGGKGGNGGRSSNASSGRGGPVIAIVVGTSATISKSPSTVLLVADPAPGGQATGAVAAGAGLLEQIHTY